MSDWRRPLPQLKPDEARGKFHEEYVNDNNKWRAEFKYDGARYLMHITDEGNRFTSRRKSVTDGRYVEKTDNFPHLGKKDYPMLYGTVLDGEIIYGKNSCDVTKITGCNPVKAVDRQLKHGWVHYVIWDVLFHKGVDVRGLSYIHRIGLLADVYAILDHDYIDRSHIVNEDKLDFYNGIVQRGGEGIILKHADHSYGQKKWVKLKKYETYDVIVIGYKEAKDITEKKSGEVSASKYIGQIGAIEFLDPTDGMTGFCSGMDDKTRAEISDNRKEYMGKMFEIRAQEKLKTGGFRHPRFIRWRDDK